jgi:hypothetical protein
MCDATKNVALAGRLKAHLLRTIDEDGVLKYRCGLKDSVVHEDLATVRKCVHNTTGIVYLVDLHPRVNVR